MDRMTYQCSNQFQELINSYTFNIEYDNYKYQYVDIDKRYWLVLQKLAQYENTNLTPEEIEEIKYRIEGLEK